MPYFFVFVFVFMFMSINIEKLKHLFSYEKYDIKIITSNQKQSKWKLLLS
jgi:hypothetical protein